MPDDQTPNDLPRDDDTEEVEIPGLERPARSDANAAESRDDRPDPIDPHELPTMPIPPEVSPLNEDPKRTLPGSGGYDPNPDFPAADEPKADGGLTVPHIVPFEHTLVHVPGEEPRPPLPRPAQRTQPQTPQPTQPNYTAPRPSATPQTQPQQYNPYPPTAPARPIPPAPPQQPPPPYRAPVAGPAGAQPQPLPQRRTKRRTILGCSPGCVMAFVGVFVTFCGGLTLMTLVLTATLGAELENRLREKVENIDTYQNFESTFYYDRNGTLLYEAFGEGRRTNVRFDNFPQSLIDATIAIEDDSFWTNPGIEVQATLRAFLQYVNLAPGESGGSTITQQLVRNVLFDYAYRAERSVQRKVEEILLALLLNSRKSKEEVLELYLNEIYYGNLAYGAQAAARTLFDKDVGELTLGEAALLAGLPQAPADLDPLNPDPAVQDAVNRRWRQVLDRMVSERFISAAQRDETLAQGLVFNTPEAPLRAPHFTVYAQQELEQLMGELGYRPEDVARGGLRVYTTVDLSINEMAQQVARDQIAALAGNNVSNAAVLVLKPLTGEILAMVGSVDYNNEVIDGRVNVTISPRQPGSTMKPFTYSAALELGMTPADVIWDTPTDIAGYVPRNYDGAFHGPVRMRSALGNSYNIPAVQTLRQVGVDYLLSLLRRFGVESLGGDASLYGLSLTLGGGEMTLLELTRGYAIFANGGSLVPTTSILCVLDGDNNILYQYEDGCGRGTLNDQSIVRGGYGRQVLDPRIAFLMTDILADNVARTPAMGANSPLNTGSLTASVKTGTTNDYKDNWTVGFTRNVAVGVWVGNSNGDPMINTSGLTGAAPIWNAVITSIYNNSDMLTKLAVNNQLLSDRGEVPPGLSLRQLCDINSLRDPATGCASTVQEWMLETPAGIPDGEGNLQFPPQQAPTPDAPPQTGPWLREVEPDIYQALVQPIAANVGSAIQFNPQVGQALPGVPLYCLVPEEARSVATGARDQLFLAPPPNASDTAQAEQYARSNGLALLPLVACTAELLQMQPAGPQVITAFISQPAPGQVVSDNTPILGTAQFSPEQALYYKLEIRGGQFPEWVTIGETHSSAVVNGQLEILPAPGLQPGSYELQLVVVGHDGNYVQPPYMVPFLVGDPGAGGFTGGGVEG